MKSLLFRILFVVLLALSSGQLLRAGLSPQVSQRCGLQTFRGDYGEIGWGAVVIPGSPISGPFARVGHAEADGKGNVTAHTIASFNGLVFFIAGSYSGTYTVSPDCTITFNMLIPIPPVGDLLPLTLQGVISENGRDLATMIVSPPLLPVRILFRKQEKNNCSNQDLSGGYGLDLWGTIVNQPPNLSGPFNRVGKVVFDGNGNFTASTDVSYNGVPAHEDLSGTYTVDSACQLTMQYTLGQAYTWFGGLYDNSKASTLIVKNPAGAVVLGTLVEQ